MTDLSSHFYSALIHPGYVGDLSTGISVTDSALPGYTMGQLPPHLRPEDPLVLAGQLDYYRRLPLRYGLNGSAPHRQPRCSSGLYLAAPDSG